MLRRVTFRQRAKVAEDEDTDPTLLKKNVILKENLPLTEDYKIHECLGSGKFGEVKRCEEKQTGRQFAAKFVPIVCKDDLDSVKNEIAIMNKLRHPRLIQLCDAYQSPNEVVMVLELITGGELFERIIDESFDLNESRCRRFMNEILQGIEYIHYQGVLHLDLKPENILCLSDTSFKIKIIDFGLARFYDGKELCVLFGTPEFVSPEVVSYEPVTPAADMWSVGVICYVMLSGLSPFMGDSQAETLANIMKTTFNFNYSEFDEISEAAQDFICRLLVKNPKKRMSASECLQHHWIKKAVNAIIALQRMGVVLHHANETTNNVPVSTLPSPASTNNAQNHSTKASVSNAPQIIINTSTTKPDPASNQPTMKERKLSILFGKLTSKRGSNDSNASSDNLEKTKSSQKSSILSRFTKRTDPVIPPDQSIQTKVSKSEEKSKKVGVHKAQTETENKQKTDKNRSLKGQGKHLKNDIKQNKSIQDDKTRAQTNKSGESEKFEAHGQTCSSNQTSTSADKPIASPPIKFNKPPLSSKKITTGSGNIADRIGFFTNLNKSTNKR